MKPPSQRIKKISEYLEAGLHTSFKSGLRNNDKNAVTQCLRIFTTLGRIDHSEQLFAEAIISPIIDEVRHLSVFSALIYVGCFEISS